MPALDEGAWAVSPEDTAQIAALQAENRRLKAELAELQERYDDLARWSVRVVGHSS